MRHGVGPSEIENAAEPQVPEFNFHDAVAELGRPEEIGIAVAGDVDTRVLLSLWMVEASAGNGERRVVVQPIAVSQDGTGEIFD